MIHLKARSIYFNRDFSNIDSLEVYVFSSENSSGWHPLKFVYEIIIL